MVIVVVRWYIKKGFEDLFTSTWEKMHPENNDGLFGEFFSTPVIHSDTKYHTLDLESTHYQTFINVGIWKSLDDFDNAIGKMIPGRKKTDENSNKEIIEVFEFEHKLRERLVLDVLKTRKGKWQLPAKDL